MQYQTLAVIKNLTLIFGELSEQLVFDGACNSLRFSSQLNQFEIAVEDLILQDEDIEVFPLTVRHNVIIEDNSTRLYFHDKNDLNSFQVWFKQHINSFIIY